MSFAVPPEKIEEFKALAAERDVEVSVLRANLPMTASSIWQYDGKTVCLLDLEFMHDGLPQMHLKAVWKAPKFEEPDLSTRDYAEDLVKMMGRLNL